MIVDAGIPAHLAAPPEQDRFVIVGGGPVGIYLAYLLSQAGRSVVLVEAGGRVVDSSRNEVATRSVGAPFVGHSLGRTFGLGGTSVVWGGQLAEFEPADFAAWPIGYADVADRYAGVYRHLAIAPEPQSVYRARMGGETEPDAEIERLITHWLPQQNFARIFKKEVVQAPNIPVLLGAVANGIVFDGDRARALRVRTADGQDGTIAGSHFIFCNGTLEIVRFFLSMARAGGVPWQTNASIGKRFQDHPCAKIGTAEISDEKRFRDYFENAIAGRAVKLHPKLHPRQDRRRPDDIGICGFFSFRSDIQENIGNIKWMLRSLHSGAEGTSLRTLPRDLLTLIKVFGPIAGRFVRDRRIMAFFDRSVDFMAQCEQRPSPDSQIRLTDEAHPLPGLWGIDIDWRLDADEMIAALHRFATNVDAYLGSRGVARLAIDERVAAADPAFVETMVDVYHHAGGMCMAASPADGVVDPDCRVWGTANVFVGGASVFPSSSHANTTFTALALVSRLAERLTAPTT